MEHTQPTRFESARVKLEEVRGKFLHLLDTISEDDWDRPFPNEGWTVRQEMVHIVQVLNVLPSGIKRASEGGRRSILALVPRRFFMVGNSLRSDILPILELGGSAAYIPYEITW